MRLTLSAPSKTFLLGEYLATTGGPCLVVGTQPRFELHVETMGEGQCEGIHPQSPAGQFIRDHNHFFRGASLRFVDPHEGRGGWGASSAQFALVHTWTVLNQIPFSRLTEGLNVEALWNVYREYTGTSRASGADVMAQMTGRITQFHWRPFELKAHTWNFPGLGFVLARTGQKLATHEHLQQLNDAGFADLRPVVDSAIEALDRGQQQRFIEGIRDFSSVLRRRNLVASHTLAILERCDQFPLIEAAKGCGALGADVILAVGRIENEPHIAEFLTRELGLDVVATSKDVCTGLAVKLDLDSSPQTSSDRSYLSLISQRDGEL